MSIVEDRFRSGKRVHPKRLTIVPGLASLLADVSRERLFALAGIWSVPNPDSPGIAAALYRNMTTFAAIDDVVVRLGEPARLVFGRLAERSGPARRSTVAKLVPFVEDLLDGILGQLEEAGLVWRIQPPRQTNELPEVWWVVPRDISRASRVVSSGRAPTPQPRDRELREAAVIPSHGHELTLVASEPTQIAPVEVATRIIDRLLAGEGLLAIMSEAQPERVRDAAHLGVAMGVLEARGRAFIPGLRSGVWTNLTEPARIRALTRMWTVDETDSKLVSTAVRRDVLAALLTAEPDRWYDANSLARLTAAQGTASQIATGSPFDRANQNRPTIDRAWVDRAIVALAVIGVTLITLDRRDRPTAVCLTPAGFQAIR